MHSLTQDEWIQKFQLEHPIPILHNNISLRNLIWFNPINHYSMRLTYQGYVYLTQHVKLDPYQFTLTEAIRPGTLLQLERHIKYPYWIKTLTQIGMFDETTALMLTLNSNNLQKYLNDIESC